VDFVRVEIYTGFNESGFVPDGDHLAPVSSQIASRL
jgi:hypothetical protein